MHAALRSAARCFATSTLVILLFGAAPAPADADSGGGSLTVYLQQAFPKQTRTNAQIEEINAIFGADFDTWDDIANLSLGAKLFRRVDPAWLVGVEVDYSAGGLEGKTTIPTEAGPARLAFEQTYSIFTNVMAAAHYFPCSRCTRVEPFVLMGLGIGYEKDRTKLTLRNDYLDEGLFVDNDGYFPVGTAGIGVEITLSADRSWFLEAGGAYYWGRLEHHVPASGSLAPAPEVLADSDTTGPNYWLGVGYRFGGTAR